MDRRAAFATIGAAALVGIPAIASADGSVSTATRQRAKFIYGSRIAALKGAVDKGDFAAVAAEKSAFILFNSGTYAKIASDKSAAIAGTNAIFAAIRAKDAGALKSAYTAYVKANDIKPPAALTTDAQGCSADFDYRVRTPEGVIYIR